MIRLRTGQRGQALIHSLGLAIATLSIGAFVVDGSMYYTVHQGMQNAADSAALAAANELFRNSASSLSSKESAAIASAQTLAQGNMKFNLASTDVDFGYVNPSSGNYDTSTFSNSSSDAAYSNTGGYNAVRVTVKAGNNDANNEIPSVFGGIFGVNGFSSQAQAVAVYSGGVNSMSGLRPIYLCQGAWDKAQNDFGDATTPQITFYGSTVEVGGEEMDASSSCGNMGPGNWGLANFESVNGSCSTGNAGEDNNNGDNHNGDDNNDNHLSQFFFPMAYANNGGGCGGGGNNGGGDNGGDGGNNGGGDNGGGCGGGDNGGGDDSGGGGGCGAPGASTVRDWFQNGYSGNVEVGNDYGVQPGNSLNAYASQLSDLKNNQTVIQIPLYDSTSGNGSNATFHVTQIASFVITDFQSTGSNKYITGHFVKSVCTSGCSTSSSTAGGITSIRLVH